MTNRRIIDVDITDRADGKVPIWDATSGTHLYGDPATATEPTQRAVKSGDQSSTSTSFADVTDLTFAVNASTTYHFRFVIFFQSSATGEGSGFSVNGPTGTYRFGGFLPVSAPNNAGSAIMHSSGGGTDSGALVSASGPGATVTTAILEGTVIVGGTGGTLALRVKTETGGANSTTVKAGSYGQITEI